MSDEMTPGLEAPFRVRDGLDRMEEIRVLLDSDELELEDQLALYREGVILASRVNASLARVQQELETLDGDGAFVV